MKNNVTISCVALCILILTTVNFSYADNNPDPKTTNNSSQEDSSLNIVDIEGLNIDIDLKTIQQGEIGLDYELEFTTPIVPAPDGVAGTDIDFKLISNGYIASEKENSQNSIISEARISGHLSLFDFERDKNGSFLNRRNRVISILSELETIDPFKDKQKGEKLYEELKDLLNPKTFRFLTIDAHAKSETDQSFDDSQFVVGVGVTTDFAIITGTNHIAKIFDFPFSILRSNKNSYITQIPRIYLGYDYVTSSDIDARKELTPEDDYSRLSLQCAWMTSILDNIQVRLTWQGYYEIDAPQGIK